MEFWGAQFLPVVCLGLVAGFFALYGGAPAAVLVTAPSVVFLYYSSFLPVAAWTILALVGVAAPAIGLGSLLASSFRRRKGRRRKGVARIFMVRDAQFTITQWIDKDDELGEHVRFYYELSNGTLSNFIVNSGTNKDTLAFGDPGGIGRWLNPACELNTPVPMEPTPATADCDGGTAAISNIEFLPDLDRRGGLRGANDGVRDCHEHRFGVLLTRPLAQQPER